MLTCYGRRTGRRPLFYNPIVEECAVNQCGLINTTKFTPAEFGSDFSSLHASAD